MSRDTTWDWWGEFWAQMGTPASQKYREASGVFYESDDAYKYRYFLKRRDDWAIMFSQWLEEERNQTNES